MNYNQTLQAIDTLRALSLMKKEMYLTPSIAQVNK